MTQGVRRKGSKGYEERELPFGDVASFLKSNGIFIGVLTILVSTVVVSIALALPQQYSKQLTLDPTQAPTSLASTLGQPPIFDDAQLGNLIVTYLQSANLDGVNVRPTYDQTTRQVNVALQSGSEDALDAAITALPRLVEDNLRKAYEEPLANLLSAQSAGLEGQIEVTRSAVGALEREGKALDESNPRSLARLEGLESARGTALAEIAQIESQVRELDESLEDLPRLADEAATVQVLSKSESSQSRAFVPVVVLALMIGLVLAVVTALVRTALRRAK